MEKGSAICIIGSANCDFNFIVDTFPKEGETMQATRSFILNGGKGANQAVAAGRLLGGSVLFAGQMGKDDKAAGLEKEMTEAGVDLKFCKKLENVDTGHAFIMINSKGENIIIIVGGANMHYDDLTKLPNEYKEAIDHSSILLLQREIPNEINVLAAKYAKEKGKIVILDFGGRHEPLPEEMINYLDMISPNDTELARMMNIDESEVNEKVIREKLLEQHPKLKVLLKEGAKGCTLITREFSVSAGNTSSYNEQISKDYKILNTVGAGDCLTGAFAAAYYEHFIAGAKPENEEKAYKQCLISANTAAYLSCTKEGAMKSMPTKSEVKAFETKYLSQL